MGLRTIFVALFFGPPFLGAASVSIQNWWENR